MAVSWIDHDTGNPDPTDGIVLRRVQRGGSTFTKAEQHAFRVVCVWDGTDGQGRHRNPGGVASMSDDEPQSRVGFTVDAEAHERAKEKTEWGELSKRLRTTIHEIAYGTEVTERKRLKEKLETLRKEKREIEADIEEARHNRDEKEREISRVENRLDTLMENDGEYDGFLQALEEDLHDGQRVDPQHGKVERAAELGDCDPMDVIEALKERNPEVPEEAFRLPKPHEQPNWKAHPNTA